MKELVQPPFSLLLSFQNRQRRVDISPATIESFAQIASLITMAPFVGTPPDSSVDINMKSLALEKARPEATLDFYGTVLRDHQKLKQTLASGGKVSADGNSLTPIELVGVARYAISAT